MQRNKIYKTAEWKRVRKEVFRLDHNECVRCNHAIFMTSEPKKITKATLVHHVLLAEEYPEYKYSIYVNGKRNLVSLCNECHEIIHKRVFVPKPHYENEERFD